MKIDTLPGKETTKIIARLKIVEGHIRGVTKMVEDGVCCLEVVNQIKVIQTALQKVNILMLDRHLHTYLITAVRDNNPAEREQMLDQIAELFAVKSKYHH
jgi:DNA-binding FrmR family transcriptional regulator